MSVGENTNQVTIATSTDGISWSNVAPFVGTTSSSGAVAYGDGQWLAFGGRYLNAPFRAEGVTMISTNGTSWLVQTNIIPFSLGLRYALAFGQDKWVMFTKFFNTNVYTASSSNFNWTPTPLPSFPGAGSFSDVHFANGLWVAVGYLPTATNPVPLIITSPNGTNWTRRSVSVTNATLDAVAYAQGQWVAVGSESIYFPLCSIYPVSTALVLTSLDGANWIRRDTSLPRGPDVISRSSLSGITWTGDEWVAVGLYQVLTERALLLTSPDAITWQMHVSVIGAGLEFAAYGNSRVVAGGATTLLLSAPIVPAAPVLGLNRAGNQLSLFLSGSIGATYDIEQAAQLVPPSWATVQSLTLSNASQQILVSPATNSSAYWRAHRL